MPAEDKKRQRHGINARVPVLVAVQICAAIYGAACLLSGDTRGLSLSLMLSAVFIGLNFIIYETLNGALAASCAAVILSALGFGLVFLQVDHREGIASSVPQYASLVCVTDGNAEVVEDTLTVEVTGLRIGGKRVSGRAVLTVKLHEDTGLKDLGIGIGLDVSAAEIAAVPLFSDGVLDTESYAEQNIYSIVCKEEDILLDSSPPGLFPTLRKHIKTALFSVLPERQAAVCFALLVGDKSEMGFDAVRDFRLAGVAHVLAVSGLHVGFLAAAVGWLLEKMHAHRFVRLAILGAVLFLFAGIAYFSPSVLRAAIMAMLVETARCLHRRSDSLNNLAIAAVCILAFRPFYLFDLRFILSFLSVAGIIAVYPLVFRLLRKMRLPKKIASSFALTVSATLGIFPIVATVFRSVNLLVLLVNFLALPLVMVLFLTLTVLVALVLIFPFAKALLWISYPLTYLLEGGVSLFAGIRLAYFALFNMQAVTGAYYIALLLTSKFVLYPSSVRPFLTAVFAAALMTTVVVTNLPQKFDCDAVSIASFPYYNVCVIAPEDGNILVVGELSAYNTRAVENFLLDNRIRRVPAVVLSDFREERDLEAVLEFCRHFGVERVYANYLDVRVDILFEREGFEFIEYYDEEKFYDGFSIRGLYSLEKCYAVGISLGQEGQSARRDIVFVNRRARPKDRFRIAEFLREMTIVYTYNLDIELPLTPMRIVSHARVGADASGAVVADAVNKKLLFLY